MKNCLLKKEINGVSYQPFAKGPKLVSFEFIDGTKVTMQVRSVIKASKAKRITPHNMKMINVAYSPIP
jgi:hypothetical protein